MEDLITEPVSLAVTPPIESSEATASHSHFHVAMAIACGVFLLLSVISCRLANVQIGAPGSLVLALCFALLAVQPLPLYWHSKRRVDMREGSLTILWGLVLAVILPLPVDAAARLRRPLQDARFAAIDRRLGVSVPALIHWGQHHRIGIALGHVYPLLIPLILLAIFAPALAGKWMKAREFLTANLVAFTVGLPLCALLPAIGPWYGYGFAGSPEQMRVQSEIFLLRIPGPFLFHPAGIVCFPSFHVAWAIFCARALWDFPLSRLPVALLSTAIVLSTMTTGWHYFVDVVAGLVVAAVSLLIAHRISCRLTRCPAGLSPQ